MGGRLNDPSFDELRPEILAIYNQIAGVVNGVSMRVSGPAIMTAFCQLFVENNFHKDMTAEQGIQEFHRLFVPLLEMMLRSGFEEARRHAN